MVWRGVLSALVVLSLLPMPSLAKGSGDGVGANEQVGGGGAPRQPADTRPTLATPDQSKPAVDEKYVEQARERLLQWEERVAELKRQWGTQPHENSRAVLGELDQGLLTAKNTWEAMRQDHTDAAVRTHRGQLDSAFARLEQTWRDEVAKAPAD